MKDVEMDIGGQVEEVWGHKGSFLSFFFSPFFVQRLYMLEPFCRVCIISFHSNFLLIPRFSGPIIHRLYNGGFP